MAEAETGTALGVVEEQQAVVGNALVGASGSAVLAESTDSTSQILEQIRDIQLKTLRGIGEVVTTMQDIFDLDKLQDRRAKENETEANKENIGGLLTNVIDSITTVIDGFTLLFDGDIMGGLKLIFQGIFDFLLAIPKAIFNTVTDILSPIVGTVMTFFKDLYDSVVLYVTDLVTSIGNWFNELATNIVTFFVDAYNTVKTTITNAVQGAFNFISDIFNSIVILCQVPTQRQRTL